MNEQNFEKLISDEEIDEVSELELADTIRREKLNDLRGESKENFMVLLDFIEKEYFKNILDKIDDAESQGVQLGDVGDLLNLNIGKIKEYAGVKVPQLIENISNLIRKKGIELSKKNSLQDVLGNSILNVLNRIIWIIENFNNEKVAKKIFSENSVTRKIIQIYADRENGSGVATYYIDELCQDKKKLKMELSSENGYLEKFEKCFIDFESNGIMHKRYPTGGEKLPFFKFFSELEKGQEGQFKTREEALDAMNKLKIKKIGRTEEEILEKENVIKLINRTYDLQDRSVSRGL